MSGYTSVDNDIFEAGLSYRAIGLLLTMLSKPPGWRFSSTRLAAEAKEGRQAVRTAMNELIEAGFVARKVSKIDNNLATRHLLRDSKCTPLMETAGDQEPDASNLDPSVRPIGLNRPIALPSVKPEGVIPRLRRGISTQKEPNMPDMEFGGGGDPSRKVNDHGTRNAAARAMNHLEILMPAVVTEIPKYHNYKVVDRIAFASYLNSNFFGSKAKTPMTVQEVTGMMDRFMSDLRRGRFRLKENQPVWMSFTRRWQNYVQRQPSESNQLSQPTIVYIEGEPDANT